MTGDANRRDLSTDPVDRLFHDGKDDNICRSQYCVEDPKSRAWLDGKDMDADTIVAFHRLLDTHAPTAERIFEAMSDRVERTVLTLLVGEPEAITYGRIADVANVSVRTVQRRVYDLRDAGVVQLVESKPVLVKPADEIAFTLASTVIEMHYRGP